MSAYRLYLIYSGALALLITGIYSLSNVYRLEVAHLNPLQLVLVGTALEVTYFVLNLPTGVIADTYSRKLSVILGTCLFGVGAVLEGMLPVFGWIIICQVVQGAAYTFIEGALESWVTDEVGEEMSGHAFLHAGQVEAAASFVGILLGVGLSSLELRLPFLLGGALLLSLGVALVWLMRESSPPYSTRPAQVGLQGYLGAGLRDMSDTLRGGMRVVRTRALAGTILLVAAMMGGFSEGFDRLWQPHFIQDIGLPSVGGLDRLVWLGLAMAVNPLLASLVLRSVRSSLSDTSPRTIIGLLMGTDVVVMLGALAFALAPNFAVGLLAYWVMTVARRVHQPLYLAWINQGIDGRVRATVISVSGQVDSLGQFLLGPLVGGLATLLSLRVGLALSSCCLAPLVALYARSLGKVRADVASTVE